MNSIDPNSEAAIASGVMSTVPRDLDDTMARVEAAQGTGGLTNAETVATSSLAKGQLLSMKLDRAQGGMSTSLGGSFSSVNKEGYMTDLMSIKVNSETEISDLKKARALLKSVIISNPKSASGWIAAARVEELDGKIQEARNIMSRACQNFHDNEDIWLEAARLSENA